MYNATDYAQNLFNLPTVAYSGEIDRQKQAADVMAREMKKVGLELTHIIGPKTGHSYEKGAKEEVNKRIDAIVEKGREPSYPRRSSSSPTRCGTTECAWVTVDGPGEALGAGHASTASATAIEVSTQDGERHRA